MNTLKENTTEEIDLAQLFKFIGNVFTKLYQSTINIFKSIFHLFILFLLFIKKHFIKFSIVGVVGLISGYILDRSKPKIYHSSMIVEPNFDSTQQLYNNIEYYNQLIEEEEYDILSKSLKIDPILANSLDKIKIKALANQTQKLLSFDKLIQELDSTSRQLIDFKDFIENYNDFNTKLHQIEILALSPLAAKLCENAILSSIEDNSYFKTQKNVNEKNILIKENFISKQLTEIDSLQLFLKKMKLLEASSAESTTTINMAKDNKNGINEIDLLKRVQFLQEERIILNEKKSKYRKYDQYHF